MWTASRRTLKILAAVVWYLGAFVLVVKGAGLFREAYALDPGRGWVPAGVALGVMAGVVKGCTLFRKSCHANLSRIDGLERPRPWGFFRPRFFLLLSLMILTGAALSRMAHGNYGFLVFVGALDLAIAVALLTSSYVFWNRAGLDPSHRLLLVVVGLFVLLNLPVIASLSRHHYDEQFYTDGALWMERTGDVWTPRFADGSPRFNKPVLTYWAALAGFKLFGVSFFSARILSLFAGALAVGLTFKLAQTLFKDHTAAVVAALIIQTNHDLYASSLRAQPDVFLCLFLTASFLGFARLTLAGDARVRNHLLAYGGAGLAVASKGLLGLLAVVYAVGFHLWKRRGAFRMNEIAHPWGLLAGLAAGGTWFVVVFLQHGDAAWTGFFGDQVGQRTGASAARMLDNAGTYLGSLSRDFLPWSLVLIPLLLRGRHVLGRLYREHGNALLFIAGWYVLLFVIFSVAHTQRTRYFLPSYPLLAALLGWIVVHGVRELPVRRMIRRIRIPLLVMAMAGGGLAVLVGAFLDPRMLVGGIFWMGIAALLYRLVLKRGDLVRIAGLAGFILAVMWTYDVSIRPVLSVSPAPAMVERLDALGVGAGEVGVLKLENRYLSQIKVVSGGRIWPEKVSLAGPPLPRYLILHEKELETLTDETYRFEACAHRYRRIRARDIWSVVRTGGDRSALEAKRMTFYLAHPQ